jgi:hypothetical protein
VRREHLYEVGKHIRLKENIKQVYEILDRKIDGFHFDFYVLSASPVEVIQSALEGIVPRDHIFGTEFKYTEAGEIESLVRATAGYGKVARLEQLIKEHAIPADHVVYVGDGSSDIHVMLQVNHSDGFTIAVSESKLVAQIAKRTVLSDNALPALVPILEDIAGWQRSQIRQLFESYGFLIQGWDRVQTDWVTLRPSGERAGKDAAVTAHQDASADRTQTAASVS